MNVEREPCPCSRRAAADRYSCQPIVTNAINTTSLYRVYPQTMPARHYYTYIMASRSRVLYSGITNNIVHRTAEHKRHASGTFTSEHRCTHLVWYEIHDSPTAAIAREKQLKGWRRAKKISLIEQQNPAWNDLSAKWGQPRTPSSPDVQPIPAHAVRSTITETSPPERRTATNDEQSGTRCRNKSIHRE